jgi:hypothetical protein
MFLRNVVTFSGLHGIISQNIILFIITTVITPNSKYILKLDSV